MKILIIGIVASGKTVLAQKLEHKLNIKQYTNKLIKIKNSKEMEEYIQNEYSKTEKKQ